VAARLEDGELVLELRPTEETLHHGIVRASVLSFVIDVVAGIPSIKTPTCGRSPRTCLFECVRSRPERIDATNAILRQGRRSATCLVELKTDQGAPIATGAIGFARVLAGPPILQAERAGRAGPLIFRDLVTLDRPLREEAGIQVIDAAEGIARSKSPGPAQSGRDPPGRDGGAAAEAPPRISWRPFRIIVRGDRSRPPLPPEAQVGPVRTRSVLLGPVPTHRPGRARRYLHRRDHHLVYATAVDVS